MRGSEWNETRPGEGRHGNVNRPQFRRTADYKTGPAWRPLAWLAALPGAVPLLNVLYAYVARKRDDWFGRHDTCALPDASFRARFID